MNCKNFRCINHVPHENGIILSIVIFYAKRLKKNLSQFSYMLQYNKANAIKAEISAFRYDP